MAFYDTWFDTDAKKEKFFQKYQSSNPNEAWRNNRTTFDAMVDAHGLKKGASMMTMNHFSDRQLLEEAEKSKHYGSAGLGTGAALLGASAISKKLGYVVNEEMKDAGTGSLQAFGVNTGTSHTLAQAQAVAKEQGRKALLKDALGHINPLGASGRESLLNSLGLMTADQKTMYSGMGMKGALMKGGIRLGGVLNLGFAVTSDDPLTDFTSNVLSGYGVQAGWRGGKAAANVLFGAKVGHASRILMGGVAGFVGGAVPMIAGEILKDATKSDSMIKKYAKKSYKQESLVEDRSSRQALTMRQAGLQKLSSSYLNDRGMLLGNEASILKGVSY